MRVPEPGEARRLLQSGVFPYEPSTLLAPMEGVTHPILREMFARRGGVGILCTEFVRITRNPLSPAILKKHVVRPSQGALSVQVMGNDLVQMAEATEMVTRAGADIVDINLGCPAPKAVAKGVGSAMLKDLGLLRQVVGRMRERTHLPLSAKIRAGYDRKDGVLAIARVLEDAGIDFLTVHPRRRVDFYDGVADWRIIGLLARTLSIPVVGNGDIWCAADALRIQAETGCKGVMMGRPAMRNPWLFEQLADLRAGREPRVPTSDDVLGYYEAMVTEFSPFFGEKSVVGLLKEQVRYLGRAILDEGILCKALLRTQSSAELLRVMEAGFRGTSVVLSLGYAERGIERAGTAFGEETCGEAPPQAKVQRTAACALSESA
jgi:nifR3 family TIM-barrel protein